MIALGLPMRWTPGKSGSKFSPCALYFREEKDDSRKSGTPTPEVDEDGFCIKPKVDPWETERGFYSSSDTDSEDERERKIRVEIKPLSNGGAPMSASVDELRATVENLSLSPVGTIVVSRSLSWTQNTIVTLPHLTRVAEGPTQTLTIIWRGRSLSLSSSEESLAPIFSA